MQKSPLGTHSPLHRFRPASYLACDSSHVALAQIWEREGESHEQPVPIAPAESIYIDEITIMLRDLLRQVILCARAARAGGDRSPRGRNRHSRRSIEHALQVIASGCSCSTSPRRTAPMRARRRLESQGGPDQVTARFSKPLGRCRRRGLLRSGAEDSRTIDVQPTRTAHPTEAKSAPCSKSTAHLLKLYDLESPRWTQRERQARSPRTAKRDRPSVDDRRNPS